jgi:MFS transporter, FSR family, fosmidomycin resistance protein
MLSAMARPASAAHPASASPGPVAADRRDLRIVGAVSLAHGCSHFFHLIVAPLFPWLKTDFDVSWAELGLLMTLFFAVSGVGQAIAGFVVDRIGPFPVLVASLACFVLAAAVLALAPDYRTLLLGCAIAGIGNAPFHPVDYSVLNARIAPSRLGRAYAVHGVAGNLGWALAPVFLVTIAQWLDWRSAIAAAGLLAAAVLLVVWQARALLSDGPAAAATRAAGADPGPSPGAGAATFAFLALPAVRMSFVFFFTMAIGFGAIQSFGPESARMLHGVLPQWAALCLTMYMLASAVGMIAGGFLVTDPARAEPVIAIGYGLSAVVAALIGLLAWPGWAVPLLFALMGLGSGAAGPSRDLLVRRASPPGATGRVYGTVYSGLDAGMALAPAAFGLLMDRGMPAAVWIGIAAFQAALILTGARVGRLSRSRG